MLKKIFTKKKNKTTREVIVLEVDASKLSSLKHSLDAIIKREIDGVLIRNFLSKDEVEILKSGFSDVKQEELTQYDEGMFLYPKAFSGIDPREQISDKKFQETLVDSEERWKLFSRRFGVDFHSKVTRVLSSLSRRRRIDLIKGDEEIGVYTPQTFRYLEAGKGQFKTHCGVAFQQEFKPFYDRLSKICTIRDQISYFVTVQKPQSGGELILYGLDWSEAERLVNENSVLIDKKGKEYNLLDEDQVKCYKVAPNQGDLILFSEGELWHRVSAVVGDVSRLTLGGFMTRSKDDKSLKMWS
ncbi:MAG: 2OG-Fe(II) oxygenase [Fluviicola sp.]|nr:2OG-Fe(II) oxygenase [Fluviicola sp.]